jgi:hypothetical protein
VEKKDIKDLRVQDNREREREREREKEKRKDFENGLHQY